MGERGVAGRGRGRARARPARRTSRVCDRLARAVERAAVVATGMDPERQRGKRHEAGQPTNLVSQPPSPQPLCTARRTRTPRPSRRGPPPPGPTGRRSPPTGPEHGDFTARGREVAKTGIGGLEVDKP
ncbi:hypothetical protein ACE1SV_23640 [Streptomyces sennicomposti]